ncbi:MAG: 7TM diverse intracellular signaling domain-containing protein [Reinekea sp.]
MAHADDSDSINVIELKNESYKEIGRYLEILHDPNDEYSPFEIMLPEWSDQWEPLGQDILNLGYTNDILWLKMNVNAQASIHKQWDLVIRSSFTDYIDVYQVFAGSGPRVIYRSGMERPFNNRVEDHRYFIVPLDIFLNPETFLIRIQLHGMSYIPMQLYPENRFWAPLQVEDVFNWLYYGTIIAMALYNLFVFFAIKDISYLFYVLFITSFSLEQLSVDGYLFQYFWPENIPYNDFPDAIFITLSVIFGFLFISSFLNLKKHLPRLNLALLTVYSVQMPIIIGALYYSNTQLEFWVLPFAVSFLFLAIALGVYASMQGLLTARYFVLAWLVFVIGNTYLISVYMGADLLPVPPLMVSKLAAFAEAMLLSFALARRIRTLRDERENQRLKVQAQSYFLAQISHEIRTPLNGVLGTVELLGQTDLNDEQQSYINIIQSSGRSLLTLVNDVLDYTKIEAGKMSVLEEQIAIHDLLRHQIELYSSHAEQKKIELTYHIDSKVPKNISSDTQRIRQILSNLISNAIKFTDTGYVRVFLFVETQNQEPFLVFEVKDSGIGISANEQKLLFDAYQQIDLGKRRVYGGTGLGLAICKELTELLGGRITMTSQLDEGSEFKCYLPLKTVTNPKVDTSDDKPEKLRPLSILVAEDNYVNQKVIQGLLTKAGHTVNVVTRGDRAVTERIKGETKYDIILMDCEMPVTDGYEACQMIRKYEKQNGLPEIPIVALTAHALEDVRSRCTKAGMNDFLAKPVNLIQLTRTIAQLV